MTATQLLHAEDCKEVVRNALDLKIDEEVGLLKYEILPVSSDTLGYMGEYYKLKISVKRDGNEQHDLNLFIKTIPSKSELHKKECEDKGFFRKEVPIYKYLLGNIQKFSPKKKLYPKCCFSLPGLLVLEDLSQQGYQHMPPGRKYSMDDLKIVLTNMATMHAGSVAYEHETGFVIGDKFKDNLIELQISKDNQWYMVGMAGIVSIAKIHPKYQNPEAQKYIEGNLLAVLNASTEMANPSREYRNVLCHRDTWDRNIFFKFDSNGNPVDSVFVDFQLTRYNPPVLDVLFFLYATTTRLQRDETLQDCLLFYYQTFVGLFRDMQIPEEPMSWEEFLASYEHIKLAAVVWKAVVAPLTDLPDGVGNRLKAEDPVKFHSYMNEDRAEMILKVMKESEEYKNIIFETIEELMDHLLRLD